MKERQERIERLVGRWFDAKTTEAEERELRDWFRSAKEVPVSLREVQVLFGGLDSLAAERLSGGRRIRLRGGRPRLWGFVAAAALALGLFFGAELLRRPYCYIDGVAVYDRETAMQATVYLEPFSALDESNRMVDFLIRND